GRSWGTGTERGPGTAGTVRTRRDTGSTGTEGGSRSAGTVRTRRGAGSKGTERGSGTDRTIRARRGSGSTGTEGGSRIARAIRPGRGAWAALLGPERRRGVRPRDRRRGRGRRLHGARLPWAEGRPGPAGSRWPARSAGRERRSWCAGGVGAEGGSGITRARRGSGPG